MKLATILIASILSLAALGARADAPTHDADSVTVRFADLDLGSEADVAALYARIKGAARRVCYPLTTDQPGTPQTYPVCVRRAMSTAVARIDRPTLSRYFAQREGASPTTASASVAAR